MVNITIYQSGEIMGDKGKVIAYEGQSYSEPITIVHPLYSGAEYFIEYKYNQTIFRDKLDSNNRVRLKIEKPGYLKCQLVALDILTSSTLFKSNTWDFLVQKGMTIEPTHYPCSTFINSPMSHNCFNHSDYPTKNTCSNNNSIDSYQAYYELLTELRNEEDIRFNEIKPLTEDIRKIKEALNISDPVPSILNANECISQEKYIAAIGSINFPENPDYSEQEYVLIVTKYNHNILQQAYESDGDNIWYRSGDIMNENEINWTNWAQNITRVTEI